MTFSNSKLLFIIFKVVKKLDLKEKIGFPCRLQQPQRIKTILDEMKINNVLK